MIILSALAGGLVYLGLAVLGWGGFAAFFAHPARLALAAVLFVLTATALFSQGNLSAGEREDRGNRWVIGAVGLIGLVSAYVPAYTDRTDFWTLDGDILRWIGVVLFAAGGVLRRRPRTNTGQRPFQRACRHPARARARDQRRVWRDPPPELSGHDYRRARLGAGFPIPRRRAVRGPSHPAAHRAH